MDMYCCGPGHIDPDEKMNLSFHMEIKPVIGGGTNNYTDLSNKPKINGVELIGNKTNEELLIQAIPNEELEQLLNAFA